MTSGRDDDGGVSPIAQLLDTEEPRSYQNSLTTTSTSSATSSTTSYDESTQDVANRLFRNSEILAPMVRASTTPLRILALSHGASLTYTEELIDRSIMSSQRSINVELGTVDYHKPPSNYSPKVLRRLEQDTDNPDSKHGAVLLRIDPTIEKDKLIYQLGTGESQLALQAALTVVKDVDGIDINMGCPKKFSISGGMGSALLSDTHRACDIVSTLRRNIPTNKPISVKLRLLHPTDPRPTLDFIMALIKCGVNAIAIHGRIVGDESHTDARWETLITVVRQLKQMESVGIPIIINGDLYTRTDINEMKQRSLCDGIMLARPALYNISLFRRDDNGEKEDNNDDNNTQYDEILIPISKFQTIEHTGKYGYHSPLLQSRTSIVQEYIANCVRYRTHSKNAKYVILEMMNTRRAPTSRVPYLNMTTFENGQTIDTVCKCRSLVDLVKVWDVKWTIPLPSSSSSSSISSSSTCGDNDVVGDNSPPSLGMKPGRSTHNDEDTPHNYDDRYFLDHDAFIQRTKQSKIASSEVGDNETKKNEEDKNYCCDVETLSVPASKRLKKNQ
jgi:tRNA-dihydrouridine synthase 2